MIFKKINIKKILDVCGLKRCRLGKAELRTMHYKLLITVLFLLCMVTSAFGLSKPKKADFVKIPLGSHGFNSQHPIELPDGNVVFPPDYILNTKTYKLEKTNKKYFGGIKLKDGTILSVAPFIVSPLNTDSPIFKEISQYIKDAKHGKLPEKYWKLSEKELEKEFLPYIKDNKELLKKYNDYKYQYENSMHGIISDLKTGKHRQVGKVNIRRNNTNMFLLNNGNVLLLGGCCNSTKKKDDKNCGSYIEIYNPKTEKFTLVKPDNDFKNEPRFVAKLNDDRIFIITYTTGNYMFYDPKTNKLSKGKPFIPPNLTWHTPLKLQDDKIFIFAGTRYSADTPDREFINIYKNVKNPEAVLKVKKQEPDVFYHKRGKFPNINHILIFDPKTEEFEYGGHLAIKRGYDHNYKSNAVLLPSGKVLIYGGHERKGFFDEAYPILTAEIYDPATGKSTIIKRGRDNNYSIDGGLAEDGYLQLKNNDMLIYQYLYKTNGDIGVGSLDLYLKERKENN